MFKMSLKFKIGMIFGAIAFIGIGLFLFNVIMKLGIALMGIGFLWIMWMLIRLLFMGKKNNSGSC